jgi:hypothetical protein
MSPFGNRLDSAPTSRVKLSAKRLRRLWKTPENRTI